MERPATLVTPQRTIHVLKSRQALHKLCESRTPKVDSKLEGNIRQLLDWDPTANGSPRWEAEDHFCLEDGRESWVVHASCDAYFPLFGSGPSHTPCRRGLGTGSSPTAEGWDWRGLGTGVPSKCVGLGTESRLAGWDWVGLGTEVLSESSEKLSSRLKLA